MRDRSKKTEAYRYRPPSPAGKHQPSPEAARERYFLLLRMRVPAEPLRRISWVNAAVVLCVLGMFFLGSFLLPKPTFSQVEQRDLATRPQFSLLALVKGEFTRDAELFFADTFPLREWFVSLSAVMEEARGIRMDDVRLIHGAGMNEAADIPPDAEQPSTTLPEQTPSPEQTPPDASVPQTDASAPESNLPRVPEDDGVTEPSTVNNGIIVYKGRAMSLFGGLQSNGTWYAETLNTYQQELPDVQIYNMLIPTAVEFYLPDRFSDLTQSQKKMIDFIYSQLDPSIKRVDAWSKLNEHTDEYLYFRTDHHWTGLGAYYAYTAFCEAAGITPLAISDFETRRLDEFIGTMYAQAQDSSLLKNPDYVDYYIFDQTYKAERFMRGSPFYPIDHNLWGEYAVSPNSYSVFLQGDFPLIQVRTGIGNGRKAMIVKESFGNAFAPFLINHFDEVYIVDQRYFQLGAIDFIKEHGVTDLIFANNTFAACTPYHIRCIDGLRHQVFVPAPPPEEIEEESSSESESQEEKPKSSKAERKKPVSKKTKADDEPTSDSD